MSGSPVRINLAMCHTTFKVRAPSCSRGADKSGGLIRQYKLGNALILVIILFSIQDEIFFLEISCLQILRKI